jgi:putative ABC transport system permease protein
MTQGPRSFRWAVRIVPSRWRESVERDLLEEAARSGRRGLHLSAWLSIQALGIAFALSGRSLRDSWRTRPTWRSAVEGLGLDVRLAWRAMARQPWSTAAIVVILAVGLSASTAAFAVFNHVLFRPIPGIADPDELATVYFQPAGRQSTYFSAPREALEAFRSTGAFVELGSSSESELLVVPRTAADAELVQAEVVTEGYLEALRVRARAGRLLGPDDFATRRSVALISERWWRSRFDGDASVIGQSISIRGLPVVIVGVVADYRGWGALRIGTIDIWIPADAPPVWRADSPPRLFSVVGRLRPEVPVAIAEEQLRARFAPYGSSVRTVMSFGELTPGPATPFVYPGLSALSEARTRGAVAEMYPFAFGASGLLLLLACANTANLLLARTMARARDLALRHAIGAGRWRLARGLFVEAGLIAVGAIVLGLVIGRVFVGFAQGEQLFFAGPALDEVFLDARVVAFAVALGAVTILLYGMAPAFAASQSALPRVLAQTHRSTRAARRLRGGLVCVQLALAMTLLAGAGVLVRSLENLRHADFGMQPEGVVTFAMNPLRLNYDGPRQFALVRDTIDQLRSAPGIESVAFASPSPFYSGRVPVSVKLEPTEQAPEHPVSRTVVSADYFGTLGIPLRAGRVFAETEFERTRRKFSVGIINESFARQLFGGSAAVGRRIYVSQAARGWELDRTLEIIGVVGDTRFGSNVRESGRLVVYEPAGASVSTAAYFVRSKLAPAETVSTVRTTIRQIEPNLPVANAGSLRDEIDRILPRERMLALLISTVALLATILGVAGVHAVIAHTVAERVREFGIRLALGASRTAVSAGVLRSVAGLALAGLGAGIAMFAAVSRLLASHVYGISPMDPVTLTAVGALLMVAALAGAWLPARRATRVDPATALRTD